WPVDRFAEFAERQREGEDLIVPAHSLDNEILSLLHPANEVGSHFIVRNASVHETGRIGPAHRLTLIDHHARARRDLQSERRHQDSEELPWLPFGLDDRSRYTELPILQKRFLGRDANLLGIRVRRLHALLRPLSKCELRCRGSRCGRRWRRGSRRRCALGFWLSFGLLRMDRRAQQCESRRSQSYAHRPRARRRKQMTHFMLPILSLPAALTAGSSGCPCNARLSRRQE